MAVFTCPQCGHSQAVDDKHVGKNATCPKCKTQGVVQDAPATLAGQAQAHPTNGISVRKQSDGKLGLHYPRNPELSILNKDSSIRREWIVVDAEALPVDFSSVTGVSALVSEESMKHGRVEYAYQAKLALKTRERALSAVEIRFLLFDVWGSHIRTLSTEEVADIPPQSEHTHTATWPLFSLNEGWHFFASLGYIARVRTKEGKVLQADTAVVLREAKRFSEKFTEEDLEPKAPKKE